jgi:hypothetical protein
MAIHAHVGSRRNVRFHHGDFVLLCSLMVAEPIPDDAPACGQNVAEREQG